MGIAADYLGRFHSIHLPSPQRGGQPWRITWNAPLHADRVRVRAWTCDCRAVFYELCHASGQGFIRKTVQGEHGRSEVSESDRVRVKDAQALWEALISGHAR
ncbi:hypothetical protein GCM10018965_032420 [Nonomuraea roseola]